MNNVDSIRLDECVRSETCDRICGRKGLVETTDRGRKRSQERLQRAISQCHCKNALVSIRLSSSSSSSVLRAAAGQRRMSNQMVA